MRLNRQIALVVGVGFLAVTTFCFTNETNPVSTPDASATTNRPPSWACPLQLPGLTNFYQVTTNLYRGAQPTAEGMRQLKAMGIKTVVNLRTFHSDHDEVAGTGLKSIRFETKPWHAEAEDVVGFLKAVMDTNNLPVFVHCQRGADRTGTMCAMYRVVVCGWTKLEAIEEMKSGGYHFSPVWKNLVTFIEQADIADLKQRIGRSEK